MGLTSNTPQQHPQPHRHRQLNMEVFLSLIQLIWLAANTFSLSEGFGRKTYNSHTVWNVNCSLPFSFSSSLSHCVSDSTLSSCVWVVCFFSNTCTQLDLSLQLWFRGWNFAAGLLWLLSWKDHQRRLCLFFCECEDISTQSHGSLCDSRLICVNG